MFYRITLVKLAAIACVFLMIFATEVIAQVHYLEFDASDSASARKSIGDVTSIAYNPLMSSCGMNNAQLNPQGEFTPIRLTNNSAESIKPRVVVDNLYLYLVWEDTRDGNREVYWQKFDRSTAQSITQPIRLTTTGDVSFDPAIAIDASGNSYVVWQEGSQYGTIFGAKIDPNGTIIIPPISLSPNLCLHPDISAVAPGVIWVVFERRSVSDQDVYVRKFNSSFIQQCQRRLNKGTLPAMDKCPAVVGQMDGGYSASWRDMNTSWTTGIWFVGVSSSCGATGDRLQANGDYQYPSIGYAAEGWVWVSAWMGSNVYNLYGTNSIARINDVAGTAGRSRVGDDPNYAYCVWSDTRDGNSEIYLSQAYSNTPFPDTRLTNNSSSSQAPDIATYNSEPGKWWVVWQDNRDGNWEIYLTGSVAPGNTIIALDKDAQGNDVVVPGATIDHFHNGSWHIETSLTDNQGKVKLTDLFSGDSLKLSKKIVDVPAQKHVQIEPTYYELWIDSDSIRDDGTVGHVLASGATDQSVYLHHSEIRYNLVVSFEWDVTQEYWDNFLAGLRKASNYLYDVTDGQAILNRVILFDDRQNWDEADIHVSAISAFPPPNGVYTLLLPGSAETNVRTGESVELPRTTLYAKYRGAHGQIGDNVLKWTNSHAIDWTLEDFQPCPFPDYCPGPARPYRGLVHELGHYLVKFFDEYNGSKDDLCGSNVTENIEKPNSVMNAELASTEMSNADSYFQLTEKITSQYLCRGNNSCWDWFQYLYEKPYVATQPDLTLMSWINAPFADNSGPVADRQAVCIGPDEDIYDETAPINVGANLVLGPNSVNLRTYNGSDAFEAILKVKRERTLLDASIPNVPVIVIRNGKARIDQGKTASNGELRCLGLRVGDTFKVTANGMTKGLTIDNEQSEYTIIFENRNTSALAGGLVGLSGNYAMRSSVDGSRDYLFTVYSDRPLISTPTVEFFLPGSALGFSVPMTQVDSFPKYAGTFTADSIVSGTLDVRMVSTSLDTNAAPVGFAVSQIDASNISHIQSPYVGCGIEIPAGSVPNSDALIVTDSRLWTHFESHMRSLVGGVFSMALSSGLTQLLQNVTLSIPYSDLDLGGKNKATIRLYQRTDEGEPWSEVQSTVDTVGNQVTASIEHTGNYALFAEGFRGDANRSGSVNIGDAVYLINYIFSEGFPPDPLSAGDVDCDETISIVDVVYLVNYIFAYGMAPCDQ